MPPRLPGMSGSRHRKPTRSPPGVRRPPQPEQRDRRADRRAAGRHACTQADRRHPAGPPRPHSRAGSARPCRRGAGRRPAGRAGAERGRRRQEGTPLRKVPRNPAEPGNDGPARHRPAPPRRLGTAPRHGGGGAGVRARGEPLPSLPKHPGSFGPGAGGSQSVSGGAPRGQPREDWKSRRRLRGTAPRPEGRSTRGSALPRGASRAGHGAAPRRRAAFRARAALRPPLRVAAGGGRHPRSHLSRLFPTLPAPTPTPAPSAHRAGGGRPQQPVQPQHRRGHRRVRVCRRESSRSSGGGQGQGSAG